MEIEYVTWAVMNIDTGMYLNDKNNEVKDSCDAYPYKSMFDAKQAINTLEYRLNKRLKAIQVINIAS